MLLGTGVFELTLELVLTSLLHQDHFIFFGSVNANTIKFV